MTPHEIIHKLIKIQKLFLQIKEISGSGEIDRMCFAGISEAVVLGDSLHPDLVKQIKENQPVDVMR